MNAWLHAYNLKRNAEKMAQIDADLKARMKARRDAYNLAENYAKLKVAAKDTEDSVYNELSGYSAKGLVPGFGASVNAQSLANDSFNVPGSGTESFGKCESKKRIHKGFWVKSGDKKFFIKGTFYKVYKGSLDYNLNTRHYYSPNKAVLEYEDGDGIDRLLEGKFDDFYVGWGSVDDMDNSQRHMDEFFKIWLDD